MKTIKDVVMGMFETGDTVAVSTKELSAGARSILERAGLRDIADRRDGQARAVKAACVPSITGISGVDYWLAGADQPAQAGQTPIAEARRERLARISQSNWGGGIPRPGRVNQALHADEARDKAAREAEIARRQAAHDARFPWQQ